MKKALIALAVLASAAASSAFAGDFSLSNYQPSLRVQANNNSQSADFVSSGVFAGGVEESRNTLGLFAGVKFNQYIGAEIGYTDLGKVSGTSVSNAGLRSDVTAYAVPLRLVGEYQLAEKFKVSGKLGVAYVDAKYSDPAGSFTRNSTRATYGIGLSYNLAPKVDVTFDADRYVLRDGVHNDTDQVAIGVKYSF
jgi:opacity protein-like surface antigen